MQKKPVILIPGIQGTKLLDANQADFITVWSGIKKFFSNIHQLALRKNGINDQHLDAVIERADVEDLAYSEIINYLKSKGYRVYIFGYDWRKSNEISAKKLAEFIEKLKMRFGNISSFNFITHSMGGLVFSAYLKSLSAEERDKVVDHAIMTVPPFLGSMEATMSLVMGGSLLFNSSDDFRKVARTFPAIYELTPVYKDAYTFQDQTVKSNFSPYNFDSFWQQIDNPTREDTIEIQKLIRLRLQELGKVRTENDFIFDFSKESESLRSKCIVISGTGTKTRQQSEVIQGFKHYKHFFEFEEKPTIKKGDGTVPDVSANAFKDSITTIAVDRNNIEVWFDSRLVGGSDQHAFFLNNGRVQNVITRFLADSTSSPTWYESAKGTVKKVT